MTGAAGWLRFVTALLLLSTALPAQPSAPPEAVPSAEEAPVASSASTSSTVTGSLREIKRLCVEDFDGGENARQLRALLIAEIHRLGDFVVTENPDKADAYVRGFGEDLIFTEQHSRDENISTRGAGAVSTGGYTRNRASASQSIGGASASRERSESRRHETSLTVRIVNADGDILWSAAAESLGGKFRSAGAEVADRIVQQLKLALREKREVPPETEPRPTRPMP